MYIILSFLPRNSKLKVLEEQGTVVQTGKILANDDILYKETLKMVFYIKIIKSPRDSISIEILSDGEAHRGVPWLTPINKTR